MRRWGRGRALDGAALAAFLPYVEVLDLADDAASHYAEIRADLKKRGSPIGANDLFIAAHARGLGMTLVTNNTAEFGRVAGLRVENWTQPPRRVRERHALDWNMHQLACRPPSPLTDQPRRRRASSWSADRFPAMRASFFLRVQRFSWDSRFCAARREGCSSE